MEQLAAAGGVTKPILYRHFGDREGLVATIGDQFAGQMVEQILSSLTNSERDAHELLVSTVNSYVAFIERDPDLYHFLVQYAVARPAGAEVVTGLMESISMQVASVIGEALREAGLDSGPAPVWAIGIVGMVHAAGNWWLDNPMMPRERLVEYLTTLLWDGLSPAAESTDAPTR